MLHLRPMQDHEFDAFFEQEVEGYALEIAASYEIDLGLARKSARDQVANRLVDRLDTKDNYFYVAERAMEPENAVIGHIWVSIHEEERFAWLDSIGLREDFRGQGVGTQLLVLLEEELAKFGIRSLSLHVFAKNERALKLYRKNGFKFTGHNMKKDW